MTQPAVSTPEQLSGRAADAVADMHDELQRRYTRLNTAEAQLAELLLNAHATSEAGRGRLQDIHRQLIEAINNPVNALDTPSGERQFLIILRGKIAEIQSVVDDGALTAEDQAELARALASGYFTDALSDASRPSGLALDQASGRAPQPAGTAPATGMTSLPPASAGVPQAAAAPAGLGAAASPLGGLASLLAGHERTAADAASDPVEGGKVAAEHDAKDDDERKRSDDGDPPATPEDTPPPEDTGPAETRPAAS